jgi:hypothetical protein
MLVHTEAQVRYHGRGEARHELEEIARVSLRVGNDHLRLRNAYLLAVNRILCHQMNGRVQLTDSERKGLAAMGAKLGKKTLEEIATIAQPSTSSPGIARSPTRR